MLTMRNDITKVKEINTEFIKSALKSLGMATKAQIADTTGISVATCGKILNELCTTGEVQEAEITSGGYGRPAKSYVYNGDYAMVACLYVETDCGKIKLSAMVSNLLGEVQDEYVKEIEDVTSGTIEDALAELAEKYDKLRAAAVGIPGYITGDRIGLCNFASLIGVPLQKILQEKFPDIRTLVENDMNAAAFGFYQNNSRNENDTIAFVYSPLEPLTGADGKEAELLSKEQKRLLNIGVDFGAGFVSGGRILRGATGFAGEVAFLPAPHLENLNTTENRLKMAAHIIESIVPILNPGTVALAGGFFDAEIIEEIQKQCLELIDPQHMPHIILRSDIHDDYVNGLLNLALAELSCSVALVERQF